MHTGGPHSWSDGALTMIKITVSSNFTGYISKVTLDGYGSSQ